MFSNLAKWTPLNCFQNSILYPHCDIIKINSIFNFTPLNAFFILLKLILNDLNDFKNNKRVFSHFKISPQQQK